VSAPTAPTTGSYIVGCDIGGTFTDTVVIDDSATVRQFKSPTTPDDLQGGVLATLELAADDLGLALPDFLARVARFAHGTTVATNTMLERTGARVGLLQTQGFGDTLSIMLAGGRSDGRSEEEMRRLSKMVKPAPLVERSLVAEVAERVDKNGTVLAPLTELEAERAVRALLDAGVDAIAISLLWSFRNPRHEQLLVATVNELAPGVFVTASSELLPRIREYERTSTTVINTYVGPVLQRSLTGLDHALASRGLRSTPLLMHSHGGLATIEESVPAAASTLLSGPAGGVAGSVALGKRLGYSHLVTTDMGGTSFDVGLVVDGRPAMVNQHLMAQYPVALPSVGITAIGAGGGSIASVVDGYLAVGPRSAGSRPGPACFGLGGTEPTVTDANLVLGFLDAEARLGGKLALDRDAALTAVRTRIAEPLGMSTLGAAAAIRTVADNKMADLIRRVTIERGHDPRDFALVAYGGGGPTHAAYYGAEVGVRAILVPTTAAVHSAHGIARSPLRVTAERSVLLNTPQGGGPASEHISPSELSTALNSLAEEASLSLTKQGATAGEVTVRCLADMRLRGQIHEIAIELPARDLDAAAVDALPDQFVTEYESRFGAGSAFAAAGIEIVTVRAEATSTAPGDAVPAPSDTDPGARRRAVAPSRTRPVYLPEHHRELDLDIYEGAELSPGDELIGPAIVELPNTSVVVGSNQTAYLDASRTIVIALENP
jgi:N-methylhydantoinase A